MQNHQARRIKHQVRAAHNLVRPALQFKLKRPSHKRLLMLQNAFVDNKARMLSRGKHMLKNGRNVGHALNVIKGIFKTRFGGIKLLGQLDRVGLQTGVPRQ